MTYVDPHSSPPNINIISLNLASDTIYLWTTTRFDFDMTTDGQPVTGVKISYIDRSFMYYNSAGYFIINPEDYNDGTYKLSLDIYTKSGTGSISDYLGRELNTTKKEWVLIIQRPYNLKVSFTGTSVENGFLKIHWKKFDSPFFHSYQIEVNDSALYHYFSRSFTNKDSISLVDSSFVGGKVEFRLNLWYYDNDGILHSSPADTLVYRFPVAFMIDDDLDSITFRWTDIPFRHTVHLHSDLDNSTADLGMETSYTKPAPGLGGPISYSLAVDPVVDLTYDHQMYYRYKAYTAGTSSGLQYSNILFDPDTRIWLVKHAMYFRKFDAGDYMMSGSYDYSWDYYDNSSIALSPDKRFAFTTVSQDLIQLSASTFDMTGKKRLSTSDDGTKSYHGIKILNDSIMYLVYNSRIALFNYKSNVQITFVSISPGNGMPSQTTFSADGRYIANCGDGGFRVYRNTDNTTLELIHEAAGEYWECIFDPANNDNLLVVTRDRNTVLHCPDMGLLKEIPVNIKGIPVNFDPVTNNLLFVSTVTNKITIYDYQNDVVKFTCNHHGIYTDFYLADNIIVHNSGYYLNISQNGK